MDFGLQTCVEFLSSFYSSIGLAVDAQSSRVEIGDMKNKMLLEEEKKEEQLETVLGARQIYSFPEEVPMPKPKECSLQLPTSQLEGAQSLHSVRYVTEFSLLGCCTIPVYMLHQNPQVSFL